MTSFQYWAVSSILMFCFAVSMLFVVFAGAPVLAIQFALLFGFVALVAILAGIAKCLEVNATRRK